MWTWRRVHTSWPRNSMIGLVGAGRFERPTPCAQVGFLRFAKCPIFKLLVSLEMRAAY
jgi:hypothetical protein